MIALTALCLWAITARAVEAAPPAVTGLAVSAVTSTSAILEANVNPQGAKTTYRFEYGLPNCTTACTKTASLSIPAGSSPVPIEAPVEGLAPATIYHFRVFVTNGEATTTPFRIFATRGEEPAGGLPDNRTYEQSSPIDKDGGDAVGTLGLIKAAEDGSAITFNSTFGIPGGKGAQALPTYLATRGTAWATQGLLPPPVFGERAQVQGWLPDFSETFSNASRLGTPRVKALISQSTTGGPAKVIAAYTPEAEYSYVGADADASTVFFESPAQLPPVEGEDPIEAALKDRPNLYAWDRSSGRLSLVDVSNAGKAPPKGGFAGPYDWSKGINAQTLREGGSVRGYYLQGTHAITASGDIYFTEAGSGQLYLRRNPTRPQSETAAGKCTKPEDACTIHVSASKRTGPDPAGAQPAAFQAASADGSQVFFTSPEKLTDDANTGPEQPAPAIGTGNVTTGVIEDADFIPKRAVGVAVDSQYVYWADPQAGAIGRAELDGNEGSIDDAFIVPGPAECEIEVETEPEVFVKEKVSAPSAPRYVAVDADHVYWTNTGLRDSNGEPVDECGTIGRADIEGTAPSVEPEFISGASNPQGIAVNAAHVYWANAAANHVKRSIGSAAIGGGEVAQEFHLVDPSTIPYGVAVSAGHVYFSLDEPSFDNGYIGRVTLAGGENASLFIGKTGVRGVAVDSDHVYWASQSENAIGRANLELEPASRENEFVEDIEGSLNGLATDAARLYWSVNGETPSNPGNDLYRYKPSTDTLEDLTPLPEGNGAEVRGVLGASEDGSRIYFAANGDLDGSGKGAQGDCHGSVVSTSGSCNLYLLQGGSIVFVATLNGKDTLDWTGTPRELFSSASYTAKTAFVSPDGQVLLFSSREKLSEYDSGGVPELYRFRVGEPALRCVSCPPSGETAGKGPDLGADSFPRLSPPLASVQMVQSRNLSADGSKAFFETAEALLPADTNGVNDVYEWEAPGAGTCTTTAPGYGPLNEGCVYLISTGKSPFPSYLADASETGGDVFFFTREGLVGQDTDELQDVYDARVGGGLASQNPPPPNPCLSTESCHEAAPAAPSEQSAGSATFVGPGNQAQKHKKPKATKKKKQNKKPNNKKGSHKKKHK